ncbi:hypothetical protein BDU57DRAFT_581288 [Ampelomyces quisqualis]|uniref:Uncharacterized protein n=1 Tax=Ampelomyces quisqualis TaxID=50730 RepID=A0A6A5QDI2_AMPQU|nr:hypothetical protein BDU57DRAFT_581288 [Ampelomyces quisqualis]
MQPVLNEQPSLEQEQDITDCTLNEKHFELDATPETQSKSAPDTDVEAASESDSQPAKAPAIIRTLFLLLLFLVTGTLILGASVLIAFIIFAIADALAPLLPGMPAVQTAVPSSPPI